MSKPVIMQLVVANVALGLSLVQLHVTNVRDDVGKLQHRVNAPGVGHANWTQSVNSSKHQIPTDAAFIKKPVFSSGDSGVKVRRKHHNGADVPENKRQGIAPSSQHSDLRMRREHPHIVVPEDKQQQRAALRNESGVIKFRQELQTADGLENKQQGIAALSSNATGNTGNPLMDAASKIVGQISRFFPRFGSKKQDQSSGQLQEKPSHERVSLQPTNGKQDQSSGQLQEKRSHERVSLQPTNGIQQQQGGAQKLDGASDRFGGLAAAGSTNTFDSHTVGWYISPAAEAEFQYVVGMKDDAAMSAFVQRMLAMENKFIPKEAEGQLAGFVQWFDGTRASEGLAQMHQELVARAWVKDMRGTLAAPGVTETQYQEMAAVHSDVAMTAFVRKLLASENKYVPQDEEGQLAGFVQWFSGTLATQTLAQMRKELFSKSWVKDMRETIENPGTKEALYQGTGKDMQPAKHALDVAENQYRQIAAINSNALLATFFKKYLASENKFIPQEDEGRLADFVQWLRDRATAQGFAQVHKELLSKSWVKDMSLANDAPGATESKHWGPEKDVPATKQISEVAEAQYLETVELNSSEAMRAFVKQLLVSEGKFVPSEDEGRLADFVQWLRDRSTAQGFAQVRKDLFSKSWVQEMPIADEATVATQVEHEETANSLPAMKQTPGVTDSQYLQTVALNNSEAMRTFVEKLLAGEKKSIQPEDEHKLRDFVQWLGSRTNTPGLTKVRKELLSKSWVHDVPTTSKASKKTEAEHVENIKEDMPATNQAPDSDVTEAQYLETVALHNHTAMRAFVKKLLASENKFVPQKHDGRLEGYVYWLNHRTSTPGFAHVLKDLLRKNWIQDLMATSKAPQATEAAHQKILKDKPATRQAAVATEAKHQEQEKDVAATKQTPEVTEAQYLETVALNSSKAMRAFVKKFLASENKFILQEDKDKLADFVQWLGDRKTDKSFAQVRRKLLSNSWVRDVLPTKSAFVATEAEHEETAEHMPATMQAPKVTEAQYLETVALRNHTAMRAFVKKLLASENKVIPQKEDGRLEGYVYWINHRTTTPGFAQVRKDLLRKSWIQDMPAASKAPKMTEAKHQQSDKDVLATRQAPEVTEAQYLETVALNNSKAMRAFVKKLLASENKFVSQEDKSKLGDFVQWLSNRTNTPGLTKVRKDLLSKSWVQGMSTTSKVFVSTEALHQDAVKDSPATEPAPEVTEAQYLETVALNNSKAMRAFVKKLLASENKFVSQEDTSKLGDFVQWLSNRTNTPGLAKVRKDLLSKSWIQDMPAASKAPKATEAKHQQSDKDVLTTRQAPEVTEAQYLETVALNNSKAMRAFVKKLLASENKFVSQEDKSKLGDFVQWLSNRTNTPGLTKVRKDLLSKSWVQEMPATQTAPEVTEAQYRETVALNDSKAMRAFVKKLLASENKFVSQGDDSKLSVFVQWVDDRISTPGFAQLRKDLLSKSWVKDRHTSMQVPEATSSTLASTHSKPEVKSTLLSDQSARPIALHELSGNMRVEFTEVEYQSVAALRDDDAMATFAKRMLASESKFVPQTQETELLGFVQWFSGTMATQSLSQMREELFSKSWVKDMHETLAAPGVTEAQYQEMAALHSDLAMSAFVNKLLASENKFVPQDEEGEIAGFVQWFSGTKATQSLAQLREELFSKSWVKDMQAANANPELHRPIMFLRGLPSQIATESEYQQVAALRDDNAMGSFAKRILESEGRFIPQEEEGQLAGFVQWFSGTKATQNLAQMREELFSKNWIKDLSATLAAPDVTEAQYREIAALHSDAAMGAFARKLLASENKFIPQEADGELEGFVQWFSGTKATQSLAQMREELFSKRWVMNAQVNATALRAGADSVAQSSVPRFSSASTPITEAAYQEMAALHDDAGMVSFVKMLLAREKKFVAPEDELELEGFVPWFSGTKAIQTLEQMREELSGKSWVKNMQTQSALAANPTTQAVSPHVLEKSKPQTGPKAAANAQM